MQARDQHRSLNSGVLGNILSIDITHSAKQLFSPAFHSAVDGADVAKACDPPRDAEKMDSAVRQV